MRNKLRTRLRHMDGVTLIELLVVIAILAILGSIAVASYRRYILRSNRTDAMTTLLQIQTEQEKFFLQNNTYATTLTQISAAPPGGLGIALGTGGLTLGGFYTIALSNATATTYTVTAASTGTQTQDTNCPAFSIDQSGSRTPASSTHCWR